MKQKISKSPSISVPEKSFFSRVFNTRITIIGLIIIALAAVGGVYAWPVVVTTTELSIGDAPRIECAAGTEIIFEHGIDASENTVITSLRLTGVKTDCAGSFVALAIYNNSNVLVDEIVWELSSFEGDSSINLIADGTTTSTSNTSNGNISEIYPVSQSDPEGFSDNLAVSSISRAEIITLSSDRAARE